MYLLSDAITCKEQTSSHMPKQGRRYARSTMNFLPNASECIRMYPNVSECVKTNLNRPENLKKLCENAGKLRENVGVGGRAEP